MAILSSASGGVATAQARFDVAAEEVLPAVDGLRIVTVRDTVLNVCYALFVLDARSPAARTANPGPPNIAAAAGERDRRLSALARDFEAKGTSV